MGFDLLDGLRCYLKEKGITDARFIPENIGFGEDRQAIYAKAEKLFLQDDADLLIAYLSASNAEHLYKLMAAVNKPMIVLDPGMNHQSVKPAGNIIYISLQGIHSAYLAGKKAAEGGAEVVLATSFYDGGYRGPWACSIGIAESGGSVGYNFVGHYKEDEFTVKPLVQVMEEKNTLRIAACFSSYLSSMFMKRLNEENGTLPEADYYCSSFMLEEQTMDSYTLPKGNFYSFIPWSQVLKNESNAYFASVIQKEKKKNPNIFHLLGWEAGIVAESLIRKAEEQKISLSDVMNTMDDMQYESPRGVVYVHPETRTTYTSFYYSQLKQDENGKCRVEIQEEIPVTSEDHFGFMKNQPEGMTSGWFNNYLCT